MQYQVYDSLSPGLTEVLHGIKPQSIFESSYVHAPWKPIQVTPLMEQAYKDIKLAGLKTSFTNSWKWKIVRV